MAELDVTYRCDCRCRMCRRWKDERRNELALSEYEVLARAFETEGVALVSIAGGEPLLRNDIFPIVECFTRRGMFVNLCTNGLRLEENADRLLGSGLTCVTVSLDGATAGTHEAVRRTPGGYEKIQRGLRRLLAPARRRLPLVRVRMTICNRNVDEIEPYRRMWSRLADDVLLQPVHFSTGAFYTGPDMDAFRIDPHRLSRVVEETPLRRNRYMQRLVRSLLEGGYFPRHSCHAGVLMVRLDPWGNVFPCLEQRVRIGSVRERPFERLWRSDYFDEVRRRIAEDGNCGCWYNNTALISHYGALLSCATGEGLLRRVFPPAVRTRYAPGKA